MRFLGTGDGAGIPNPFCRCRICENARRVGGKERRFRSCFRISQTVVIDLGADFASQVTALGEDLYDIEHVLYTHTHEDHFNSSFAWERSASRVRNPVPMNVYLSEQGFRIIEHMFHECPQTMGCKDSYCAPEHLLFHKLAFGVPIAVGDLIVTPLRGNHVTSLEDHSTNYLIQLADGRKMYYGLDTGTYLEETFEALKRVSLDLLISECTEPFERVKVSNQHMNYLSLLDTLDRLWAQGTISAATKIYVSHIQPSKATHAEMVEYFAQLDRPYSITVAWDGLTLDDHFNPQE